VRWMKSQRMKAVEEWAVKVIEWVDDAVKVGAYDDVMKRMDDVLFAFFVLIKDEYRDRVVRHVMNVVQALRDAYGRR